MDDEEREERNENIIEEHFCVCVVVVVQIAQRRKVSDVSSEYPRT